MGGGKPIPNDLHDARTASPTRKKADQYVGLANVGLANVGKAEAQWAIAQGLIAKNKMLRDLSESHDDLRRKYGKCAERRDELHRLIEQKRTDHDEAMTKLRDTLQLSEQNHIKANTKIDSLKSDLGSNLPAILAKIQEMKETVITKSNTEFELAQAKDRITELEKEKEALEEELKQKALHIFSIQGLADTSARNQKKFETLTEFNAEVTKELDALKATNRSIVDEKHKLDRQLQQSEESLDRWNTFLNEKTNDLATKRASCEKKINAFESQHSHMKFNKLSFEKIDEYVRKALELKFDVNHMSTLTSYLSTSLTTHNDFRSSVQFIEQTINKLEQAKVQKSRIQSSYNKSLMAFNQEIGKFHRNQVTTLNVTHSTYKQKIANCILPKAPKDKGEHINTLRVTRDKLKESLHTLQVSDTKAKLLNDLKEHAEFVNIRHPEEDLHHACTFEIVQDMQDVIKQYKDRIEMFNKKLTQIKEEQQNEEKKRIQEHNDRMMQELQERKLTAETEHNAGTNIKRIGDLTPERVSSENAQLLKDAQTDAIADEAIADEFSDSEVATLLQSIQTQREQLDKYNTELNQAKRLQSTVQQIAIKKLQGILDSLPNVKEHKVEIVEDDPANAKKDAGADAESQIQMTWSDAVSIMNQMRSVECTASIFAESFTAVDSDDAATFTTLSEEAKNIKDLLDDDLHTAQRSPSQQIAAKEQLIRVIQHEEARLRKKLEEKQADGLHLKNENSVLQSSLDNARHQVEAGQAQIKALNKAVKELEAKLKQSKDAKIAELQASLRVAKTQRQAELTSVQDELAALKQHKKAQSEALGKAVKELEAKLKAAETACQAENDSLKAANAALKKKKDDLKLKLTSAEEELASLKKLKEEEEFEESQAESKLAEMATKIEGLKRDKQASIDGNAKSIADRESQLRFEFDENKQKLTDKHKAQLTKHKAQLSELKKEHEMETRKHSSQMLQLMNANDDLFNKLDGKSRELEKNAELNQSYEQDLKTLEDRLSKMDEDRKQLEQSLSNQLRVQAQQRSASEAVLEKRAKDAEKSSEVYKDHAGDLKVQLAGSRQSLERNEKDMSELNEQLRQKTEECKSLTTELHKSKVDSEAKVRELNSTIFEGRNAQRAAVKAERQTMQKELKEFKEIKIYKIEDSIKVKFTRMIDKAVLEMDTESMSIFKSSILEAQNTYRKQDTPRPDLHRACGLMISIEMSNKIIQKAKLTLQDALCPYKDTVKDVYAGTNKFGTVGDQIAEANTIQHYLQKKLNEMDTRIQLKLKHLEHLISGCEKTKAQLQVDLDKCKADLTKHEQVAKTTEKPKKVEQPVKIQEQSKRASPWLPVKGPRKEVRELQGLW